MRLRLDLPEVARIMNYADKENLSLHEMDFLLEFFSENNGVIRFGSETAKHELSTMRCKLYCIRKTITGVYEIFMMIIKEIFTTKKQK